MNKTKDSITFLILHYECLEDTINCYKSIKELDSPIIKNVVIVDNGSKKEPIKEDEPIFSQEENVYIIRSEKNLGFAKGNNLGFQFAKEKLNTKFIVMTNADTIFPEKNFINLLLLDYKEHHFEVAGPNIISLVDNLPQNPLPYTMLELKEVKRRILKNRILYIFSYLQLDFLISYFYKMLRKSSASIVREYKEPIVLHGACMIFSPQFIQTKNGLYPGTFMYGEEDILAFQCKTENLEYIYLNNLKVLHKEGSSTDVVLAGGKKRRFRYSNINKSYKKLLRMMKEYE